MGADKRTHRRVPIVAQIEAQAGGFPFIAITEDISIGGLRIHTTKTMDAGQIVHLKFTLPDSQREIRATGVVQHVTPGQYLGVHFQGLDPADLAAIEAFISAA